MELILDDKILCKRFNNLCKKYSHYMWAVAWAGKVANFDLAKILADNAHKIDKILVGLHFYQTDPTFIECFKDNRQVRYYKKSDGIFHSKVYLFCRAVKRRDLHLQNSCLKRAMYLFSTSPQTTLMHLQERCLKRRWWTMTEHFCVFLTTDIS